MLIKMHLWFGNGNVNGNTYTIFPHSEREISRNIRMQTFGKMKFRVSAAKYGNSKKKKNVETSQIQSNLIFYIAYVHFDCISM